MTRVESFLDEWYRHISDQIILARKSIRVRATADTA